MTVIASGGPMALSRAPCSGSEAQTQCIPFGVFPTEPGLGFSEEKGSCCLRALSWESGCVLGSESREW